MKKLLLVLLTAALPGCMLAQIKIGETTYPLLTEAIAASVSGDVIEISGPVMLTEQVGLAHATGVRTFKGMTPDASITLATGARFILEAAGETIFEDITLIGAEQAHEDWGAILTLFNGPTLILRNDTIRGAKTNAHAGAIRVTSGATVEAYNTVFADNEANQNGGVAFIEAGNTETLFDKCVFINNKAGANSVDAKGGALFYAYGADMKDHIIKNSAFIGNSSSNHGGAVGMESVNPVFVNCTFSGNTTVDNGGAIWMWHSAAECTTTLVNCTFYGNSAGNGSALFMNQATTHYDVKNCAFVENDNVGISSAVAATINITNSYFPELPEGLTLGAGNNNMHTGDTYLADLNVEEGIVWHEVTTWRSALVELGNTNLLKIYSQTDQSGAPRDVNAPKCTAGAYEYAGEGPVLGINEEELSEVTVHPNPAADYIIVKTPSRSNVSIYNINGQLMTTKSVAAGEHRFDVSQYTRSVYVLKNQTPDGTKYTRFIIK